MRILYTLTTICLVLSPVFLSGCSNEDETLTPPTEQDIPEMSLATNEIKVKIGTENAVPVEITNGGGEYNVFSLDSTIAKGSAVDGKIIVEGFANGQTSLIVSDKNSRYKRLTVDVYTTDQIKLESTSLELKTRLGSAGTLSTKVTLGNGGYFVKTDNPKVSASVTEDGVISISAISALQEYVAKVTVSDQSGISADINVKVTPSMDFFDEKSLDNIKADATRRYYINKVREDQQWYCDYVNNTTDEGRIRYGYINSPDFDEGFVEFQGDRSIGTKENATFSYQKMSWGGSITKIENQPITLKIIKNDGTNIWAIFTYVDEKEEKLYGGYFCDTIEPK